MADGVLFEIAAEILKDLGSAAVREIGQIWGVNKELVKLEGTMSSIKTVLRDAEKKSTTSHQVKNWLEKLEDAVYDADDLVDEFRTRALMHKNDKLYGKVITFFSSSNQIAFNLRMSQRIKEIRKMLDQIKADKAFFLLEHLPETSSVYTKSRETHSFVPDDEVIGRDKDKKNIIQLLLDDGFKENVSVIPIIGMGGLGKTTLAQHVFNDAEVTSYFELKLWVCVSDPFDLKIIVEKMVKSCSTKSTDNFGIEQLQNIMRETIGGKRYLLVLDDVWTQDRNKWIELRNLLIGGARGSKILVTARSDVVAKITKTDGVESYRLTALTKEKSWSLFKKMAFEKGKEPFCSDTMLEIGMEIADKCSGIPLAIKTIGSLLYTKSTEAEWLAFKDTELVNISKEEGNILATLKLSYNHLPSHLKHCFVYCSLFPKDSVIDVPSLIQSWMAHGFVVSSGNQQCLDDVGYGYFMELFGRSFFQEVEEDDNGFVISCKIHDLMHDLASSMGRSFFLLAELENCPHGKVRYLNLISVTGVSRKIPKALLQKNKFRSLNAPYLSSRVISQISCVTIMSNFKLLRELNLSWIGLETLPSSLGDLIHLRYLNLTGNYMKELPKSIIRLHNLQTLILVLCHQLLSLPRDIIRLPNLRHLDTQDCHKLTYLPSGIGQLTSLRTLGMFPVPNDSKALSGYAADLNELKYLKNMKGHLEIKIMGHGKHALDRCETTNLEEINLRSLWVSWPGKHYYLLSKEDYERKLDVAENDEAILDFLQPNPTIKEFFLRTYMGTRISPWISSLSNLVILRIYGCKNLESLPSLDQFHGLKQFKLSDVWKLEFISTRDDDTFPPTTMPLLESLQILDCPNLKGWWKKEKKKNTDGKNECSGSITEQILHLDLPFFPSLKELDLRRCPKLTSMPLFPNVEHLSLEECSLLPLKQSVAMMNDTTNASSNVECAGSSYLIYSCPKLKKLSISKLDVFKLEFMCNLPSLRSLTLTLLDMDSLPLEIGNLTSLESLCISNCKNLASLPESIGNLSSLRFLHFYHCDKLVELPEAMSRLKSLQSLRIGGCFVLEERCKRSTGKEWPKIAHIPTVTLNTQFYFE